MEGMIGEIRGFAGNFAPRAWAFCEGQLLSIAQNTALFSILGTIYGGDGRTTFALPDLRGRTMIGPGNGPGLPSYREGQRGGSYQNVLNTTQIPSHNHSAVGTVQAAAVVGDQRIPGSTMNFAGNPSGFPYSTADANVGMKANNVQVTVGNTGGNQPINNMQPYNPIYYIICMQGVFPSRS